MCFVHTYTLLLMMCMNLLCGCNSWRNPWLSVKSCSLTLTCSDSQNRSAFSPLLNKRYVLGSTLLTVQRDVNMQQPYSLFWYLKTLFQGDKSQLYLYNAHHICLSDLAWSALQQMTALGKHLRNEKIYFLCQWQPGWNSNGRPAFL